MATNDQLLVSEDGKVLLDKSTNTLTFRPKLQTIPSLTWENEAKRGRKPILKKIKEYLHLMRFPDGRPHMAPRVTVIIPKSIRSIEREAFLNTCVVKVDIESGSNLRYIGNNAFCNSNLEEINLENISVKKASRALTIIHQWAFENTKLKQITIPEGFEIIREKAFFNCRQLQQVVLPSTLTTLGEKCFLDTAIDALDLSHTKLEKLEKLCLPGHTLRDIKLPPTLRVVMDEAFSGCHLLTRLELPSVEKLGHGCLDNCDSLVELKLGDRVGKIGQLFLKSKIKIDGRPNGNPDLVIDFGLIDQDKLELLKKFSGHSEQRNTFPGTARLYKRRAESEISVKHGTCLVESHCEPHNNKVYQTVLNCYNITRPVTLASLDGESYEVDIRRADVNESLKVIAKQQHVDMPDPREWSINLHTEELVRDDMTIADLMVEALNNPEFDYSEVIQIVFKTPSPVVMVPTTAMVPTSVAASPVVQISPSVATAMQQAFASQGGPAPSPRQTAASQSQSAASPRNPLAPSPPPGCPVQGGVRRTRRGRKKRTRKGRRRRTRHSK